jgi:hypothetical protein
MHDELKVIRMEVTVAYFEVQHEFYAKGMTQRRLSGLGSNSVPLE